MWGKTGVKFGDPCGYEGCREIIKYTLWYFNDPGKGSVSGGFNVDACEKHIFNRALEEEWLPDDLTLSGNDGQGDDGLLVEICKAYQENKKD